MESTGIEWAMIELVGIGLTAMEFDGFVWNRIGWTELK